MNVESGTIAPKLGARPTLRGHLRIARVDHWFKNVFVLPGIIAAIGVDMSHAREASGRGF